MPFFEEKIAADSGLQPKSNWLGEDETRANSNSGESEVVKNPRELHQVLATMLTTLTCFGVFFIQGMIIARILGPIGRGEFGSAIYFPRDILLYVGLLGGIEIVNTYAKKGISDSGSLRRSAAKLGIVSGTATAIVAAILSAAVFTLIPEKTYLIPFCLLACVFLPFEHMQLTISAVDRGEESFSRYNLNRLIFALAFPLLVLIVFGWDELFQASANSLFYNGFNGYLGISTLTLMCLIFVLSKIIGLLPTLRGMDVISTLVHWQPREGQETNLQSDELSVPGVRRLLTEGRPYALSMFATEVFERLDIFLILALGTMQDAGYYFVAVPAAALLTVAPNALGVFTFNAGADTSRNITLRQGVTVMLGIILVQVVATIFFMFLIPYLIVLFYSNAYASAIPFALWLLPACAIKGYLQAVDGYLKGRGKPLIGVWARVLSILVMLAFVGFAYSSFELISIPMAACVGQSVSMLIITFAVACDITRQTKMRTAIDGEGVE